jgi:hypothetical protein
MYLVYEPGDVEPPWRRCEGEMERTLSPDVEPACLGTEELAEYETVRKAYGIVE